MKGYFLFRNVFENLNEETKKVILKNIFLVKDVSNYSIILRDSKLFYRFFSEGIFYQFIFHFRNRESRKRVLIRSEQRVVTVQIFIHNYDGDVWNPQDSWSIFLKILTIQDEYLIYFLSRFLI